MKRIISSLAITLTLYGCSGLKATYLEMLPAGTLIKRSLYSVSIPKSSPEDKRSWERYSKDGKQNDFIIKYAEGIIIPSYAASVEMKESMKGIVSADDIVKEISKDKRFMKYASSKTMHPFSHPQENLLCIRPGAHVDAAPDRPHGFFWHKIGCLDKKTNNYYELNVSYLTTRKGDTPPGDLSILAESFFKSFEVVDYSR